ncbi:uncharacterized protein isoform X2 [Musca autumnalis]|uniref:uncharacterized protein isoform X2 n=1 Tax=Musca autumnalis TaxID=221902 RepID=UPI003CF8AA2C
MLPPPLATSPQTPTTTMRITTTTTPITDRRNESAFVYNPADTTASRITSKATTTTIDGPTQRLKAMLNKTLSSHKHNNTAANNGDYSAQYFGSPVLASDDTPHVSPTQLETYADDEFVYGRINDGSGLVGNGSSFDSYATAVAAADMAVTTLTNGTHLEAATTTAATTTTAAAAAAAFPTAQTVATFIAAGNKNRATTIIVYPTVSPESIVIPIVSCIFGFPILAFIVICCLRHRAKMARERDRRRNYDMQDHAVSLITDRRELSVYVLNEA